jgi:hypothetical protein
MFRGRAIALIAKRRSVSELSGVTTESGQITLKGDRPFLRIGRWSSREVSVRFCCETVVIMARAFSVSSCSGDPTLRQIILKHCAR